MKVTGGYNAFVHQAKRNAARQTTFKDSYSATKGQGSKVFSSAWAEENTTGAGQGSVNYEGTRFHHSIDYRAFQTHFSKNQHGSQKQINMESKGDQELEPMQAFYLKGTYDMENLNDEARHNLLCDLTNIGVLSSADITSDDQSKVEAVLTEVKSMKMGVFEKCDMPEQQEVFLNDGTDPNLRGLSDDEKFAAIVKEFGGGRTLGSFSEMVSKLYMNKLITRDQGDFLCDLNLSTYCTARDDADRKLPPGGNLDVFHQNYRVTMKGLLAEAERFKKFSRSIGQKISPLYNDEIFLKDFASKVNSSL